MARRTRLGRPCLRKLDAGVEASGPHDFAVRSNIVRQRAVDRSRAKARPAIPSHAQRCRVHRIPPRVRDDRDTPLLWDETASDIEVIWVSAEQEYFCKRGWTTQISDVRRSNARCDLGFWQRGVDRA